MVVRYKPTYLKPLLGRSFQVDRSRSFRFPKTSVLIVVLFAVATFSACLASPRASLARPSTWTYMVYLDADNDLEDDAILDFLEMSSAGSTSNVRIVVQFDRAPGYDNGYGDWETCKRFLVTPGMTPTAAGAIQDLGEVNMGSEAVLADFLDWAVKSYPATHYLLDLWDHGGDWLGLCWDETASWDYMEMSELDGALATFQTRHHGIQFDVICLDLCSMGSVEVACQLAPYASYMVASEIYIPDQGFEYSGPLSALISDPNMTAPDLCADILTHYQSYYESLVGTPEWHMLNESYELSFVDLGLVGDLATAADALATELMDSMKLWVNHIALARNATEDYDAVSYGDAIDLLDFARNLRNVTPNATIDSLCDDIEAAVVSCVLGEVHGTNPDNCSVPVNCTHGMTLYFQSPRFAYDSWYPLSGLTFTDWSQWDEFLELYQTELDYGYPTVLDFAPSGVGVSTDSSIEILFSEEMNPLTLPSAFSIMPTVTGSVYTYPDRLVFVPDPGSLVPGITYSVVISVAAEDTDGTHLGHNFSWQFTTSAEPIPEFSVGLLPIIMIIALVVVVIQRRHAKP